MEDRGIVIRTAFNNHMWQGRCKDPFHDQGCYQCVEKRINVGAYKELEAKMEVDEKGFCIFRAGKDGWVPIEWVERVTPSQRIQQREEARAGQRVKTGWVEIKAGQTNQIACAEKTLCTDYFWENFGRTFGSRATPGQVVFFVFKRKDRRYTLWGKSKVTKISEDRKRIFFQPFKPLSENTWVQGLSTKNLVDNIIWGNGTYRYIDEGKVSYLEARLIEKSREQIDDSFLT